MSLERGFTLGRALPTQGAEEPRCSWHWLFWGAGKGVSVLRGSEHV